MISTKNFARIRCTFATLRLFRGPCLRTHCLRGSASRVYSNQATRKQAEAAIHWREPGNWKVVLTKRNQKIIAIPYYMANIAIAFAFSSIAIAQDTVIDFESVQIGKPAPTWTDQGVTFGLAHQPKKSKAVGRISFFPHLGTNRKGIVNAMANEAIPVRATFEKPVKKARLVLWGSTTSSALVEAFDVDGKRIATDRLEHVPVRKTPEDHVPFFELAVEGEGIAYIEISGSQPGGFVAVDEIRWSK